MNYGINSGINHELIPEKIRGMTLGITHDMIIGRNIGRSGGLNNDTINGTTTNEKNHGRIHGTNLNSETDINNGTDSGMNHEITKQLGGKLKIIIEKLPGLLEDYKKYFIFFHKNPEIAEYQQIYVQYQGADQMIDDFKTLYNNQYYKNVQIIYGIGIIGFVITFLMKKK